MSEIIFIAGIAAILLIGFASTFVPRDSRYMRFRIDRTGRRAAGPASTTNPGNDRIEDGPTSRRG